MSYKQEESKRTAKPRGFIVFGGPRAWNPVRLAYLVLAVGALCLLPAACSRSPHAPESPCIVVTTTLIETAVRDLAGDRLPVFRLVPPGTCPAYFDLEPGQVRHMRGAVLFVRHQAQERLDEGARRAGLGNDQVLVLSSGPSPLVPVGYVDICVQLAERFLVLWPGDRPLIEERLEQVRLRAAEAEAEALRRADLLRGRKVLSAVYQRDFCAWLGLDPVAVFTAGADESAWLLGRAVDMARTAGAEWVVGNRQWGPRHLEALAEAAGLPGIMLSSYPSSGEQGAYWALFRENLEAFPELSP